MTADELNAFFAEAFPDYDPTARPVTFADGARAVVRHRYAASQLRPGGRCRDRR